MTGSRDRVNEWRWLAGEMKPFALSHALSLSMLAIGTAVSAIDPLIIKWLVDSGLRRGAMLPVVVVAAVFVAAYNVRIFLSNDGLFRLTRTVQFAMLRLRQRLFAKLQSMDATFHESHPVGDLVSRLEQEVEQLGQAIADLLPALLRIVVTLATTFTIMLVLNWRMALLSVPLLATLGLLRGWFGPRLQQAAQQGQRAVGERAAFATESIGASIELQLLGAQPHIRRRYGNLVAKTIRTALAQVRTELHYAAAAGAVMTICSALLLVASAFESLHGRLTVGGFIAFYTYVTRLFEPLSVAVAIYGRLKRASGSIARLQEIERESQPQLDPAEPHVIVPGTVEQLEVASVAFSYPGRPGLLDEIDIRVRRGEKVALMGKSGSGKSTIAKLIARVYDGHGGNVRMNGVDVRDMRLRDTRDLVAFVPAKPVIFGGTILDNVLLGAKLTPGELDRLAHIACFDSVVGRFPEAWQHPLGANGSGLSDGEKQRLGILRALVRCRDVLILDEATSALDGRTEETLLQRLRPYADDRLLLVVSHRNYPAEWADRIVLLENGRVREKSLVPQSHRGIDLQGATKRSGHRQQRAGE